MRLSILLPSNRPEGLEAFLRSLGNYDKSGIEIIVLVDDVNEYVEYDGNIVTIHKRPTKPVSIGQMQHECYKIARGQWIALLNDDVLCETIGWEKLLFAELEKYKSDEIALLWFNDKLFGNALSCMPIVSKKALELINFFPVPYQRYKIDDTLFAIFPSDRKIFLKDIVFRHLNTEYTTQNWQHPEVGKQDAKTWNEQIHIRMGMMSILHNNMITTGDNKILIGVPSGGARYGEFDDYLNIIQKPNNTFLTRARSQSPAKNRNLIIQQALDTGCTHVLFLDDDMAFQPDVLVRLLAHDKDIVTGLYYLRSYPHPPAIFDGWTNEGHANIKYLNGDAGLIPVTAAGLGCVLIRTNVFKRMNKPWIRLGELESDMWCDDIGFFLRVHKEVPDVKMFCDLDVRVGHMSQVTLWPTMINDKWHTTYSTYGEGSISIPQLEPK